MKTTKLWAVMALACLGGSLMAEGTAAPRVLAKRWGFGLDTVPGASSNPVSGSIVAAPNAVAVRWWATERLALDLLGAMDVTSFQSDSGGGAPATPASSSKGFGLGLGVKFNATRPSRDLLIQWLGRVSAASSTQTDPTGLIKVTTATTGIFLGAGFEAFVPGWDWLSLEGSAGIAVRSQTVTPDTPGGAGASQSSSTVSLGGAGFTPINLSLHAYF